MLGSAGEGTDTLVWDSQQKGDAQGYLQPMTRLQSRGRSVVIECNPRYNMFASADTQVQMWLPSEAAKDGAAGSS